MAKTKESILSNLCMDTSSNPLTKSYWKQAASEFKNLRTLTAVAMLMALTMVISNYFIPLGDNLKVFFTFLPKAVYCAIGGPLMGLAAGFVSDILGYMMHADGGFFPGYTLSTMLGCFTYALFLYRTKITFTRCLLSKVCVSLFVNIGLGSLWSQMMYGKGYLFYLGRSVIKNITLLPVEVLLMFAMFCALRPIAKRSR